MISKSLLWNAQMNVLIMANSLLANVKDWSNALQKKEIQNTFLKTGVPLHF
jgi:hypothetical protein